MGHAVVLDCKFNTQKSRVLPPEPEKFDPRRLEGNEPAPYTYVPFGECAGKDRVCANGNIGVHAQLSEEVQVSNCYS